MARNIVCRPARWALATLVLIASISAGAAQRTVNPTFADVVTFVAGKGWVVNLGPLCGHLEIQAGTSACVFRQVSVEETEAHSGPRGFNVPADSSEHPPHVLIYHLGPLVGEFFIVSPEGQLLKAFLRRKGTGYSSVPLDEVREEFAKDAAYWTVNLARLKEGLRLSPRP